MALLSPKVIAQVSGSSVGKLGAMSWEWIMRADGQVFYRLTKVNGRRERNPWTLATRLPAAELGAIRGDKTKATQALDVIVRQHGHLAELGARSENRLPGARQPGVSAAYELIERGSSDINGRPVLLGEANLSTRRWCRWTALPVAPPGPSDGSTGRSSTVSNRWESLATMSRSTFAKPCRKLGHSGWPGCLCRRPRVQRQGLTNAFTWLICL
jgi:hypothetical protein